MENASPTPGVDYPRKLDEMDDWFRTEAQCRYLRQVANTCVKGIPIKSYYVVHQPKDTHGIHNLIRDEW